MLSLDDALPILWLVLGGAGIVKGLLRFSHDFFSYQPMLQTWLRAFPGVGLVLLIAIGLLCAELLLARSEEHKSELQSLMRISYAVFCLKQKIKIQRKQETLISYNSLKRTTSNR